MSVHLTTHKTSFLDMPEEMQRHILSFLSFQDLKPLALVNSELCTLCRYQFKVLNLSNHETLTVEQLSHYFKLFPEVDSIYLPSHATDAFLEVVENHPSALKAIHIFGTRISEQALGRLCHLRELHVRQENGVPVSNVNMDDPTLSQMIDNNPALEVIDCPNSDPISLATLQKIVRLPQLRQLSLNCQESSDATLSELFTRHPDLEVFDLPCLDQITPSTLTQLSQLYHLKKLTLCSVEALDDARLAEILNSLSSLEILRFSGLNITETGLVQAISLRPRLKHLILHYNLPPVLLNQLLRYLPDIQLLNYTAIPSIEIASLKNLERLYLTGEIDSPCFTEIARNCSQLKVLSINGKMLSAQALAEIARLPHLQILSLYNCTFDEPTLKTIVSGCLHLRIVGLVACVNNSVKSLRFSSLQQLPALRYLRLINCNIDRTTAVSLQRLNLKRFECMTHY